MMRNDYISIMDNQRSHKSSLYPEIVHCYGWPVINVIIVIIIALIIIIMIIENGGSVFA